MAHDPDFLQDLAQTLLDGRVTVLVGSGVSGDRSPPTPVLKQRLIDQLAVEGGEAQLRRLSLRHLNKEPSECTLAELLSLLSNAYSKAVPAFLLSQGMQPRSDINEIPPLSAEILAHLMAHRLIDHIFSFNYDEALEVALDDELGEQNYEWIRSDSLFRRLRDDMEVGLWPSKPLVVKPHGTISFPTTIRPTPDTVQTFDSCKADVLRVILNRSDALVMLGFSSVEPDIQKILKEFTLSTRWPVRVFWIDNDPTFPDTNPVFKYLSDMSHGNCRFLEADADALLVDLARCLYTLNKVRCPAVTRHELRNVFRRVGALRHPAQLLQLETMIYALKSRGLFSLEGLLSCARIENYCTRIRRVQASEADAGGYSSDRRTLKAELDELIASGFIKRDDRIVSTDAYYVPTSARTSLAELLPRNGRVDPDTRREVLRLSSDLRKTFDFHIDTSSSRNYYYLKFYFPEPLEDHETLRERTVEVLTFATKGLNIITETAEWLMGEEFADAVQVVQSSGLSVRLILAALGPEDDCHRTTQEAKWQRLIGMFPTGLLNIRILPWEDHEIHMTTTDDGRGIYFVRRHKETKFIPWHISDPRDAQQVLAEFDRFWSKAVRWESTLPAPTSQLASTGG